MSEQQADALVFFGATGDLAYKKIFPALQAMARRGHLALPVVSRMAAVTTPSAATRDFV